MSAYGNAAMLHQQSPPQPSTTFVPHYPPPPGTSGNAPPHAPIYANVDPQLGHGQSQPAPKSGSEGHAGEGKARLRKACDACSHRKVKCDESGPPCKACQGLNIECTFNRPSKRRGPPNKVAQAMKKGRYDEAGTSGQSQPSSPTHAAHTLASIATQQVLSAESICSWSILQPLIEDYFVYIHPLVPLPHEPSFRAALERREDVNNSTFLAMLAAMIGCVVANFPRKLQQHSRHSSTEHSFPNSMSLVERCHKIAIEAQGVGYLDRILTIHDAVTNYLLGLTSVYTLNRPSCIVYFRQCLTILTTIGAHKPNTTADYPRPGGAPQARMMPNGHALEAPHPGGVDLLMQEISRRTFWVMFVSARSLQQLGVSQWELPIPPATKSEPYPPLSMEVDDTFLAPTHIQQPAGSVSQLTAFNAKVRLHTEYNDLTTMELLHGVDQLANWEQQKGLLERSLHAVKHALRQLPTELVLTTESPSAHQRDGKYPSPASGLSGAQELSVFPSNSLDNRPIDWNRPGERNRIRSEIQKVNIHVSQLSTRLYLVEKYLNLQDTHKGDPARNHSPGLIAPMLETYGSSQNHLTMTENDIANEREEIVKSFLSLLGSMDLINMAPHGVGFITETRQIATTLLDSPRTRKGPYALRAEEHLSRSLNILMQLERAPPGRESFEDDEPAQMRRWHDFQEQQARFAHEESLIPVA